MKKVTSVIVALMMLFSICTVVASAAVNDAVLALRVTPTATSYKPGDVVTFEVSYEATADLAELGICTVTVGYDSNVFEPIETVTSAGTLLNTAKSVIFDGYALAGKVSLGNSFIQTSTALTSVDTAKGWDAALKIAMTKEVGSTLVACPTETKMFAFQLKVKDSAVGGTHLVGITDGSIQDETTFVDETLGAIAGPSGDAYGFSTSKIFDLGDASVTVEGGTTPPPAATVKVNNLETQVQWANKDAGLMNLGFRGQIAEGYDATADKDGTKGPNGGDNLTKLTEVGFYLNGTKYSAYTIYDFVNGGYFYRVVVGNVSYDSETVFSAQAYVMIDGQEYKADASFETTGKAQYERAKDSMGAK
jgi:hypothetical protein